MTTSPEVKSSSRGRIVGARALLVLGVLLTVVSILSTYVKREALDPDQFKQTSQELIASPAIQQQVAAELVDAFNANVDLSAELEGRLPENLQALAGPLAGISGQLVDRAAQELVTRPRAQDAFVEISSAAQAQFVKVLHGDTRALETSNGNVVLDLRPLMLRLGDRFGFIEGYAAKFPAGLRSDHHRQVRRPEHCPDRDALARAGRELRLDPRDRLLGRRHLARPWSPPPGGALARDRARRGRRARPSEPLGRGEVLRRQPRPERRRAARCERRLEHHHGFARRRRLGCSVRRNPDRDRRLARRPRATGDERAHVARARDGARRVRVGRVRSRDGADHLDPADPGVPDDRRPRRRRSDRLPDPSPSGRCGARRASPPSDAPAAPEATPPTPE